MSKKGKEPSAPGDYEVGYGKPPQATQFKPGQSGNPKGRPKGRRNVKTILEDILYQPVTITENGKARKVPAIEALFKATFMNAMKGDHRATDRLLKQLAILHLQNVPDSGDAGHAGTATDTDIEVLEAFAAMVRDARFTEGCDNEA